MKNLTIDADAAILVYSLADPSTLSGVEYFLEEIKNHASKDIITSIIGNKLDLCQKETVASDSELDWALKVS